MIARHLLSTRHQKSGESNHQFLNILRQMAKDRHFEAVDALTYREQMIRDAFIKGLSSSSVSQRIPENEDISLQRAFDLALSLSQAHDHSAQLTREGQLAATSEYKDYINNLTMEPVRKFCFFCGGQYHNRDNCPARNAECFLCNKKGHFSRDAVPRKLQRRLLL